MLNGMSSHQFVPSASPEYIAKAPTPARKPSAAKNMLRRNQCKRGGNRLSIRDPLSPISGTTLEKNGAV